MQCVVRDVRLSKWKITIEEQKVADFVFHGRLSFFRGWENEGALLLTQTHGYTRCIDWINHACLHVKQICTKNSNNSQLSCTGAQRSVNKDSKCVSIAMWPFNKPRCIVLNTIEIPWHCFGGKQKRNYTERRKKKRLWLPTIERELFKIALHPICGYLLDILP